MQARYKWLILPPAVALVLFMGPLRDVGMPPINDERVPEVSSQGTSLESEVGQGIIPMPSAWQMGSTLLGVLLLGGAGIMLLARLRRGPTGGSSDLMSLRQSLRLSQRHKIHAVQFDHRLLLLGECDGQLTLIKAGSDPEAMADEEHLAARGIEEDTGAVPRDMVIPRPGTAVTRRPRPPKSGTGSQSHPTVDEFKDLLRRVKTGAR